MPSLMTKGEFAAHMNVGPSAVSNWNKKGLILFSPDPDRPGRQLVDAERSALLIRASVDTTRGRPRKAEQAAAEQLPSTPGEGAGSSSSRTLPAMNALEEARLAEMRERTTTRQIENGRLLGQLVSLPEYERRAADMGRMLRERSHGLVRKLAERLAAEIDPRAIVTLLGDGLDGLFDQVAGELEASLATETAVDTLLADVLPDDDDQHSSGSALN
ncbi:hypothetical protein [Caulobacter sp. UNC279MFTsu5.1]|uniref:hypothetical protein n=1 Tax=Caulobacter sp. UNC279MFTsu5.1 TaxID=1502775 RepID=UPI000674E564|nr:hypothetical protein [Caulobacter sp. UNC279MFTsu5.1]SFK41910.1 hypothetical protein SAMN02799626_04245 [Caulobacter sp. UNC279MFTsu5.1]